MRFEKRDYPPGTILEMFTPSSTNQYHFEVREDKIYMIESSEDGEHSEFCDDGLLSYNFLSDDSGYWKIIDHGIRTDW